MRSILVNVIESSSFSFFFVRLPLPELDSGVLVAMETRCLSARFLFLGVSCAAGGLVSNLMFTND